MLIICFHHTIHFWPGNTSRDTVINHAHQQVEMQWKRTSWLSVNSYWSIRAPLMQNALMESESIELLACGNLDRDTSTDLWTGGRSTGRWGTFVTAHEWQLVDHCCRGVRSHVRLVAGRQPEELVKAERVVMPHLRTYTQQQHCGTSAVNLIPWPSLSSYLLSMQCLQYCIRQ